MKKKTLILIGSVFLVSGCTLGPDFIRPTVSAPEIYHADEEAGESIANLPWWELFGDPVLQELVTEALENNRNLLSSMARIDEARASLGISRSEMYPNVDYFAGGAGGGFGGRNVQPDDFTLQILAKYRIAKQFLMPRVGYENNSDFP